MIWFLLQVSHDVVEATTFYFDHLVTPGPAGAVPQGDRPQRHTLANGQSRTPDI